MHSAAFAGEEASCVLHEGTCSHRSTFGDRLAVLLLYEPVAAFLHSSPSTVCPSHTSLTVRCVTGC